MTLKLKIAEIFSINNIMMILDAARDYQRSLGFIQWEDGYPSEADIMRDVSNGIAHIFIEQEKTVGYVALAEYDESYDSLTDTWQFGNEYGVVHRLAFSSDIRGRGLTVEAFRLIEEHFRKKGLKSVRIDTGEENIVMQRVLENNGYQNHGKKMFAWGPRIAYEKKIL